MSREKQSIELENIVFIGRTFKEYLSMFDLSSEVLRQNRILDCPAGACSFTAEANQKGSQALGCDIAYAFQTEMLAHKGMDDIQKAMQYVEVAQDRYVWSYFKDVDKLREHRVHALQAFVEDRMKHPQHYVYTELPHLPFESKSFDLLLSAHFLFMYDDRLDLDFHLATVQEYLRVAKEIRIFPLINLKGERSSFVDEVIADAVQSGWIAEECRVSYEFQTAGHTMLKLIKA